MPVFININQIGGVRSSGMWLRHQVICFLTVRGDVLVLSSSDEMTKKEPKIRSKSFSNVDSIMRGK